MCQQGKQSSKIQNSCTLYIYNLHTVYNLKTVLSQVSKSKIREKKWDVVILQEMIEDWILCFEDSYFWYKFFLILILLESDTLQLENYGDFLGYTP